MSGWFGGSGGGAGGTRSWQTSLDSLKSQVTSSLREVVDAVAVDPSTLNPEDGNEVNISSQNHVQRVQSSPDIIQESHRDLNDQLEAAINEITRLKTSVESQAVQIQKISSENQRLAIEKDKVEKQKEIQVSQLKELLMDKEEEINQLLETSKAADIGEEVVSGDANENMEKVKHLEESVAELNNRLKQEELRHVDELNELRNESVKNTEVSNKMLNAEIKKLKNENSELIEELEKMKTSSSHIGSNSADERAGDESSDNSISEHHEIGRLKEEKSQLTEKVSELEKEALASEKSSDQKNDTISDLEKQVNEKDEECQNYKNICDDLQIRLKEMSKQNLEFEQKLEMVTKECDVATKGLAETGKVLESERKEKYSSKEKCEELIRSLQESETAVQKANERLDEALCENNSLKIENSKKDKEINEAAESYQELASTKSTEKAELMAEIRRQKVEIEDNMRNIEQIKKDSQESAYEIETRIGNSYEEKLTNLNQQLEKLKIETANSENVKKTYEEVNQSNISFKVELEQTHLSLVEAKKTISEFKEEIDTLKQEQIILTKIREDEDAEAKTLVNKEIKLEHECTELKEKLKTQTEETEVVRSKLELLSKEHDALKETDSSKKDAQKQHEQETKDLIQQHEEKVEKLETRINNMTQTSIEVAANIEKQHKETIEQMGKEQEAQIEALQLQIEALRNDKSDQAANLIEEYKGKIAQLETKIMHSTQEISDLKEMEESRKCEIEKMDCVIKSLRESNTIMKEHAQDSVAISEQYQQNLAGLRENLMDLQEQLAEQTRKNLELSRNLEETQSSKEELAKNLIEIAGRSDVHEKDLGRLQLEVDALTRSEAESQEECERLRQQEVKTIENTELYKRQYEQLLQEYNQYLEDLESVQSKLKGLETLKTTYEEENASLRELSERYKSEAEALNSKVQQLESISTNIGELETTIKETKSLLEAEKLKVKEMEDRVKERDTLIEDLQSAVEETKQYSEIIEKQDSESKEKDENWKEASSVIQQLEEENKGLKKQIEEHNKTDEALAGSNDLASDMMVEVLNEKTRENSHLKKENERLMQNLAEEQRQVSIIKASIEQQTNEKEEMSKIAVHKLSQIIKDKDMEIEALGKKNESLLTVLQSSAGDSDKKKSEYEEASKALLAKSEECKALQLELMEKSTHQASNKAITDNSNEIIVMKDRIHELERKLNLANIKNEMIKESRLLESQELRKKEYRKRFYSESFERKDSHQTQGIVIDKDDTTAENAVDNEHLIEIKSLLRKKEETMMDMAKELEGKEELLIRKQEESRTNQHKINSMELRLSEADKSLEYYKMELEKLNANISSLQGDKQGLLGDSDRLKLCLEEKEHDLEMAKRNLQQLTEMLEEKSNKSESQQLERLQNLSAIQELQAKISEMSRERDAAKVSLADRDREMVGLRKEVNSVIDKKKRLEQELDRLKKHLVAVEESYTQEAIESEERERELRKKLQIVEDNLRNACVNSSDSFKAAQAKESSLESKLVEINQENVEMRNRLFSVESEFAAQKRAMENLNLALEGFQHEKVNDLKRAEMMYDAKLSDEKEKSKSLERQIFDLEQKVASAAEGLAAAHRLGDQLEAKGKVIATLRQEIKLREELLKKARQELEANAGKVDRYLVKNLVVGYVVADNSKKPDVLKIIATVLDFNEDERSKTGLGKGMGTQGWIQSWFGGSPIGASGHSTTGHRRTTSGEVQAATGLDLGIAQAFVKFMETESKPKPPPLQIPSEMTSMERSPSGADSRRSSGRSTPTSQVQRQATPTAFNSVEIKNPLLGAAVSNPSQVIPTFTANRSSSAILKNVLHEEAATVNVPLRASSAAGESAQGNSSSFASTSNVQNESPSTSENSQNI